MTRALAVLICMIVAGCSTTESEQSKTVRAFLETRDPRLWDMERSLVLSEGEWWKGLAPDQRQRVLGIFAKSKAVYALPEIKLENCKIQRERISDPNAEVDVQVVLYGKTGEITFRLYRGSNWRICDLVIDGESSAASSGPAWSRICEKCGFEKMCQYMERTLVNGEDPAKVGRELLAPR